MLYVIVNKIVTFMLLYCRYKFLSEFHCNLHVGRSQTSFLLVEELKTNLMSLVVFISLIFAQHVSNINMSIFRSLRL